MDHKDKTIEELTLNLEMAEQVKKSEVLLNKDLKEIIEKQKIYIETLQKINEDFCDKIAKLRIKLNKLINE
jgi:DNA-directed RNA polymerase subunit H (RpoH/RPB5)